jgi:cardiolipin synthase
MYREYDYALALFIAAAATDLLDGLTARLTNQMTYLGRILDPVADKFFIVTSFILMTIYDLMPRWLTIVVISKDVIVVVGCIILYFVTGSLKVDPSMLGKTASACQFILVGMIILFVNIGDGSRIPEFVFIAVALLTAASGIQYIQKGLSLAASENREAD